MAPGAVLVDHGEHVVGEDLSEHEIVEIELAEPAAPGRPRLDVDHDSSPVPEPSSSGL